MAKEVRNRIKQQLERSGQSITIQWNAVNVAFSNRVREYLDAKDKLQNHLLKVRQAPVNHRQLRPFASWRYRFLGIVNKTQLSSPCPNYVISILS